jgi:hypothetical protein
LYALVCLNLEEAQRRSKTTRQQSFPSAKHNT